MNMTTPPDLDGLPLELLIKIMKMTTASEDTIAVAAIRKANNHIAKLGTDWESLLRGKVRIIADPFANINIPQDAMNPNRNQPFRPSAPSRPAPPPKPQDTTTVPPASAFGYGSIPPRAPRPKPQPSPVKPKPGAPAFSGDVCEKTIINKFEGTCVRCKNRVPSGDGIAKLWSRPSGGTTYWTTEHSGTCPSTTRSTKPNTIDGFQV